MTVLGCRTTALIERKQTVMRIIHRHTSMLVS
jgi:hypothetical protein